jgi:hypothetical protein
MGGHAQAYFRRTVPNVIMTDGQVDSGLLTGVLVLPGAHENVLQGTGKRITGYVKLQKKKILFRDRH